MHCAITHFNVCVFFPVVIAGRGRHVRLVPIRALECPEAESVKLGEAKGAVDVAVGELHSSAYGFAVVCKRQVRSKNNQFKTF